MQIILRGPAAGYEAEHTARLFFPGAEKSENLPQEGDFVLAQSHQCTDLALLRLNGKLQWQTALRPQGEDAEYALCRLLYGMLCRATGITPPWGMMTGVRPVRIIHDMRAAGAGEDEIRARFLDHFGCAPEKFALALGIADLQKPVLDAADPMDCSVYAGIPFCPTRCSYCSFVSRTVGDKATRALVQPYVDKLCEELTAIRRTADRAGLHIRTFYIGGGTPTSLNAPQLEQLMSHIAKTFDLAKLDEYTVEAGRPDCTDAEKLRIIKKYGATRISINPQTFSDTVLQNIGRRHTAQDIIDCFAAARAAGHTNINMDLIAGLPTDTPEGFSRTLDKCLALAPDNLTVHTLALKKGSRILLDGLPVPGAAEVGQMLDYSAAHLSQAGYTPYYLYRQKYMSGNFENVGWSKPGAEGLYNIYIMEELHSILSVGAGGSTKLVDPRTGHIVRHFNCKYAKEYLEKPEKWTQNRAQFFAFERALLRDYGLLPEENTEGSDS